MRKRYVVLCGMIVLALLCTIGTAVAETDSAADGKDVEVSDDLPQYNGPFGPDNALYELRIGL